ncbi:MFS transporter [Streptomyces sp. NPDC048638]|uniref:MFS transporter n=1 Tax=Streptomyces sp. NPDC048638 TaxID=3365580 RepID=UPI00371804EE
MRQETHHDAPAAAGGSRARRDLRIAAALAGGSACGDSLAKSALVLRVHDVSHAPWSVTALLLAGALPVAACAPGAGLLADRVDSRTLMICANAASALCCLWLTVVPSFGGLLLVVTLLGVTALTGATALNALLPSLAEPGRLVDATARQRGATLLGGAVGLSSGGVLAEWAGTGAALALDAASFVLLGLGCAAIRTRRGPGGGSAGARRAGRRTGRPRRSPVPPLLLAVSAGSGVVALFAATTNVVQVFFVKDVLGVGDAGYGLIAACWTGGMLACVPLARQLPDRVSVLVGATVCGEAVTGLAVLGCGLLATVPATALCYVVAGLAASGMLIARGALVQLLTPESARGRVQAAVGAVRQASTAAALGLGAALVEWGGPRIAFIVAGAGSLAVSLACGLWLCIAVRRPAGARALAGPLSEPVR